MTTPRPSVFPDFAMTDVIDPSSLQPNVVEPNAGKKNVGWVYNEKPPRQYFNWLSRMTSTWLHYADEQITAIWNAITNVATSEIANDSSVTGTTAKDALNTLLTDVNALQIPTAETLQIKETHYLSSSVTGVSHTFSYPSGMTKANTFIASARAFMASPDRWHTIPSNDADGTNTIDCIDAGVHVTFTGAASVIQLIIWKIE